MEIINDELLYLVYYGKWKLLTIHYCTIAYGNN